MSDIKQIFKKMSKFTCVSKQYPEAFQCQLLKYSVFNGAQGPLSFHSLMHVSSLSAVY